MKFELSKKESLKIVYFYEFALKMFRLNKELVLSKYFTLLIKENV